MSSYNKNEISSALARWRSTQSLKESIRRFVREQSGREEKTRCSFLEFLHVTPKGDKEHDSIN